ncbi:MAG: DoxX family protein [Acidobacteria bacterium]|nr:DoxX family protein [Acidobacteriota bacterium]
MQTAVLASLNRHRDLGLLIIRLVLGVMFILHGYPKLLGGPELWTQLGGAMAHLGIDVAPQVWGLLAALAETVGGLFLLLGLFTRLACLALTFTMIVAATMHLSTGDGLQGASHAIELGAVFLGLVFVGPGRFSVDGR